MADQAAEQIKYETEVLRLTWVTVLALGGGTASLLLSELTGRRLILAGAGVVSILVLIVTGWRLDRKIRRLVAQLKEDV